MATTFFSNEIVWAWQVDYVRGTLTGNVSRSGNTVTLSGMSLALTWANSSWGSDTLKFTVNGTQTSRSVNAKVASYAVNSTSFTVGASDTSKSVSWSSSDGRSGSFTVTFPAGFTHKVLDVNLDRDGISVNNTDGYLKFDIYVPNTTKVGSQVTDYYNDTIAPGTSWKVNNITEQSREWYYSGNKEYSGTLNADYTLALPVKPAIAPTGYSAVLVSRAWNQIVAKSTLASYGAPNDREGRWIGIYVCKSTDTDFVNYYHDITHEATTGGNKTFTTLSSKSGSPDKIIGCMPFKLGASGNNTKKWAGGVEPTVYYLPPAPMASISLDSITRNNADVTFKVKTTGKAADGTNNISGAKVNLQYRYSTDDGGTYTPWANAATNYTPDTAQTISFNIAYNKAVKIQVRQATYQDTSQVTAALMLDIAAVQSVPDKPSLTFSWDELDRTLTTVSVNNGTGGTAGGSSFKHFEYQMSWNSDFSNPFVDTISTTAPYTYSVSYLKPLRKIYIRVRTVNNQNSVSDWVSVSPTVPRPLWGLVKGTNEVTGNVETVKIRDIVKVKTDNTVSARDWIEGTNNGKKRIVET